MRDGAGTAAFWGEHRLGWRQIASLTTIGALLRGARDGQPRPPCATRFAGDALAGQAFVGVQLEAHPFGALAELRAHSPHGDALQAIGRDDRLHLRRPVRGLDEPDPAALRAR